MWLQEDPLHRILLFTAFTGVNGLDFSSVNSSVELCVNNVLNEVYQIILSVEDLSFTRKKILSFMGFPWGTICPFANMT
jgi:hypothetical protein